VKFLRSRKHGVKDVKEEKLFGYDDYKLLQIAAKENRVIITHDKDFANISRNRSTIHSGIIIIRLFDQSPENAIEKLQALLEMESEIKIKGSIITIREDRIEVETRK